MAKPIFVSYVSEDERCRQLLGRLAGSMGLTLVELGHQKPTHDWRAEFRRIVRDVSCVVVLVGETTFQSEPVEWEIEQSLQSQIPVLAVRVSGDGTRLPKGLEHFDVVDLDSKEASRRLAEIAGSTVQSYLSDVASAIASELPSGSLPEGPVDELMAGYAVLLLAKGTEVTGSDVHNAWSAWMMAIDPAHPAIVPFDELDEQTATQDEPFVAAIRRAARKLGAPNER